MKILFTGTGAADWDWSHFHPETRGCTSTLFGSSCLVDAGESILQNLKRSHVSPSRLRDLLITHSHRDHFSPEAIASIAQAAKGNLRIWATKAVLEQLPSTLPAQCMPIRPGDTFSASGCTITVLPSNHATHNLDETTCHFLFVRRGIRLLYALDGGWFNTKEHILLKQTLQEKPLTTILWDATCGATIHDVRFSLHNDLKMIQSLRQSMLKDGLISADTVHVFTHIARTLWPTSPKAQQRLADRYQGLLAYDGMTIDVS